MVDKRFAGINRDDKQLDADVHRRYIFGGHVAAYMRVSSFHSFTSYSFSIQI